MCVLNQRVYAKNSYEWKNREFRKTLHDMEWLWTVQAFPTCLRRGARPITYSGQLPQKSALQIPTNWKARVFKMHTAQSMKLVRQYGTWSCYCTSPPTFSIGFDHGCLSNYVMFTLHLKQLLYPRLIDVSTSTTFPTRLIIIFVPSE